ncbi:uncharacterized protein LOC110759135 [Prunus avium]|uniref:Uncharacterized protein LOC110759135 n=1 Tax=Prunus avium TaxID=42229 RepID=A0A6P5STC6_PRUAV|nr:uncharacterized protein LOC110759135 [Prunus avium]
MSKSSLFQPIILLSPTLLIFGTLALLCIFMSLLSQVHPQAPNVQLNSLFMSKFNISNTTLGANWDMTLTIDNPNLVTWVRFNHIKGSISYKDNILAISSVEPFVLGLKERRTVRVKISTLGLREEDRDHQLVVKKRVLDEMMSRRREDGAVHFSMQMFVWATYRTGWWGTQDVVMSPQCLDLKAGFLRGIGFGSWISGGPMMCSVPILIN